MNVNTFVIKQRPLTTVFSISYSVSKLSGLLFITERVYRFSEARRRTFIQHVKMKSVVALGM